MKKRVIRNFIVGLILFALFVPFMNTDAKAELSGQLPEHLVGYELLQYQGSVPVLGTNDTIDYQGARLIAQDGTSNVTIMDTGDITVINNVNVNSLVVSGARSFSVADGATVTAKQAVFLDKNTKLNINAGNFAVTEVIISSEVEDMPDVNKDFIKILSAEEMEQIGREKLGYNFMPAVPQPPCLEPNSTSGEGTKNVPVNSPDGGYEPKNTGTGG